MSQGYSASSQEVAQLFDEKALLREIARELAEALANELDPDGANPNLVDEIMESLESDPTFYEKLSEAVFDGNAESAEAVNGSLRDAAVDITGAAVPAAIAETISDVTKAMQEASKAANDNIPQSFRDAFDDATEAGKNFGRAMTALAVVTAIKSVVDSDFSPTEAFKQYVGFFGGAAAGMLAAGAIISAFPALSTLAVVIGVGIAVAAVTDAVSSAVASAAQAAIQAGVDVASAVASAVAAAIEAGMAVADTIADAVADGIDAALAAGVATAQAIADAVDSAIDAGMAAVEAIAEAVANTIDAIKDAISDAVDAAVAGGQMAADVAAEALDTAMTTINNFADQVVQTAVDAYNAAIATGAAIADAIADAVDAAENAIGEFLNDAGSFLQDAFDEALDFGALATEAMNSALSALNDLLDTMGENIGEAAEAVGDWMQGVWDAFVDALNTGSPLVLDLDGDGIELISLADTSIYWDIDEDGYAEAMGWVAADDGLLAIDLDGDGAITEHTELFGSLTQDGFTALSVYDTNADGVIDANDAQFADLLVWQDVNQNGISESDELYTLDDLNITSIDVAATQVSQTNAGHDISHVATYTVDDGVSGPQVLDIVDVWFQYDNLNTNFTGDYTLDLNALFVTTMRGYGNMPDLHVAASMDNDTSNPDSLMSLLTAFSAGDLTDFFVQDGAVLADVREILFRWAGVDGVDPQSRGNFVDARELGFLETLFDEIAYSGYNPGGNQGENMSYTFDLALQGFASRLIAQTAGSQLFAGDFYYNPITDGFEGITGLSQTALDALLIKAQDASQISDKVAFWGDVVRVIDQVVGVANLSTGDAAALETAITTSDSTLSTQLVLDTLAWNADMGQVISGSGGADTLDGTIGDDTIYGGNGNDVVTGGIGADTLRGQAHNDTLNGQSGDDFLYGHTGNDTYLYFAGQGHDTITEYHLGTDKIVFGAGVTFGDLTLTRLSNTDLHIDVSNTVGGGAVTILDQFGNSAYAMVETLEFADSSTVDLSTMVYTLTGTEGADTLKGIRYGGSQEDTIHGLGGDDVITGYFSTLDYGNNWLYGGDGNDTIYGAHGVDHIEGGADNDHIRGYNGSDELHGGAGNDELWGQNQNDVLYGEAGDDILKGDNHNDVLTGGLGADELWGGSGYDTFTFLDGESFDAIDTIKDFHTSYDAIDISDLLSAYDPLSDAITDFVQITDDGTNSTLAVDVDGGADSFASIALIVNKTGLTDEAALEASGKLITA